MSPSLLSLFGQIFSLSASLILLFTSVQRYVRLKNEYEHYERRQTMLQWLTQQKRDELEHLIDHIRQLLLFEEQMTESATCAYDHGDHLTMLSFQGYSTNFIDDDDDESEDDPLLQRLKLTKPSRLKNSIRED